MLAQQSDILKNVKPEDWLCHVKAILGQDIYRVQEKL